MRLSIASFFAAFVLVGACATSPRTTDDDDGFTGNSVNASGTGGTTSTGNAVGGNASSNASASNASASNASTSNASTVSSTSASSVVASSSTGTMNCFTAIDCPDCLCTEQPTGCNDYITAVMDNIYCGATCGPVDCAAFCSSMDPLDITTACDTCVANVPQPDIDAFFAQCQLSADCITFVGDLSMCP